MRRNPNNPPPGKGRPKGSVNKLTATVKEAFEIAFTELQGDKEKNLAKWGKENPTEFYKLASKLIPAEMNAKITIPAVLQVNLNGKPNSI